MANKRVKNLVLEDCSIIFRNFSGREQKYNPPGKRNFCVLLDKKEAASLDKEGWNVRYLQPRDEQDEEQAYLPVSLNFDNFPPKVVMVTKHNQTNLDADTVGTLDWAEIETVDLIVRPYSWEFNGKSGIKGYVKSMYVTIVEDEFADKYNKFESSDVADDDDVPF